MADGTPPPRFALEHAHYADDLPFWRMLAQELGSPVLDLGAAVGRIAIPLARDGVEVWALDSSEGMLAELRGALRKEAPDVAGRVRPLFGDMRRLSLDGSFAMILMAMNTFQGLLDTEDQIACLEGARDHLQPGGELVFDLMLPDLAEISAAIGVVRQGAVHRDPVTGATLMHAAWYDDLDPVTQTARFTLQIDEMDAAGSLTRHLRPHTVHLYMPTEVRHLIARAGLHVRAVYGGFEGEPLGPDSSRQIYRCGVAR